MSDAPCTGPEVRAGGLRSGRKNVVQVHLCGLCGTVGVSPKGPGYLPPQEHRIPAPLSKTPCGAAVGPLSSWAPIVAAVAILAFRVSVLLLLGGRRARLPARVQEVRAREEHADDAHALVNPAHPNPTPTPLCPPHQSAERTS
mgnify:CR=1 FL=1